MTRIGGSVELTTKSWIQTLFYDNGWKAEGLFSLHLFFSSVQYVQSLLPNLLYVVEIQLWGYHGLTDMVEIFN